MSSQLIKGNILLFIVAMIWGSAFVSQKIVTDSLSALSFNGIRFSLAVLALIPLLLLPSKIFDPEVAEVDKITTRKPLTSSCWFAGSVAGLFMFVAIWLQQVGLSYTTSGKAGFLTAIYIVITPIIAIFFRQRCSLNVWLGAIIVLTGIYILTLSQGESIELQFNLGDILIIISAFGWAFQVIWLSIVAKRNNVLKIAIAQMFTVAILSCIAAVIEHFTFDVSLPTWDVIVQAKWQILYTGVVSASIAFTLQIIAQRHVPPVNAALVMSLESFFAMIFGVLFLDEPLTRSLLWGCGCIFIGTVLSQIPAHLFKPIWQKI